MLVYLDEYVVNFQSKEMLEPYYITKLRQYEKPNQIIILGYSVLERGKWWFVSLKSISDPWECLWKSLASYFKFNVLRKCLSKFYAFSLGHNYTHWAVVQIEAQMRKCQRYTHVPMPQSEPEIKPRHLCLPLWSMAHTDSVLNYC